MVGVAIYVVGMVVVGQDWWPPSLRQIPTRMRPSAASIEGFSDSDVRTLGIALSSHRRLGGVSAPNSGRIPKLRRSSVGYLNSPQAPGDLKNSFRDGLMDFLEHGGYSSFPIRREWQSRFSRGRSSRCLSEPNPNGILRYKFLDKGIPLGHSPLLSAFSSIMEPLRVSSLAVELLNLVRRTLSFLRHSP